LDEHVPVAAVVEEARVDQLEFRVESRAPAALVDQSLVRILGVWILVEVLHVAVSRRVVEVVVVLLDVLAVVALAAAQAEQPLLEKRISPGPEREREGEITMTIRDAAEAILVPSVGLRAGVIVREILPGVATGAVVLAHGAPGTLGQERPPPIPVAGLLPVLAESGAFPG